MVFTKKGDFQLAVNILLKAFPQTGEHESCGYKKYWQLLKLHYKALFMKKSFPNRYKHFIWSFSKKHAGDSGEPCFRE